MRYLLRKDSVNGHLGNPCIPHFAGPLLKMPVLLQPLSLGDCIRNISLNPLLCCCPKAFCQAFWLFARPLVFPSAHFRGSLDAYKSPISRGVSTANSFASILPSVLVKIQQLGQPRLIQICTWRFP